LTFDDDQLARGLFLVQAGGRRRVAGLARFQGFFHPAVALGVDDDQFIRLLFLGHGGSVFSPVQPW